MRNNKNLLLLVLLFCFAANLQAQYFGKNKAHYETFDFKVVHSPNFEIYHYLDNQEYLQELTNHSEQWFQLHQNVLNDTFPGKNPIIFYSDHADFQQTNAISSQVGVGTGGVTEGFKNRVILPIAMSNQQTHHVIGHELVHAFQYDMIINGDSTSIKNLSNIPLWMIEGLAEYMSIGSIDAHTAMWMRDAVLNDDVPSLKQLDNPKYFPYRYGQAFWAFLTGLKGDDIIKPFFTSVAKYGFEKACLVELQMSKKNLSALWENAIKNHFGTFVGSKKENLIGKALINKDNGGRLNIAPSISPNGRYVAFLSEKGVFSVDLFVADARTGEVLKKMASTSRSGHIDDFNYVESGGSWSPNSKNFAFVGFSKGKNILIIKEALTGKTIKEMPIKGVPAFSNPTWAPKGNKIVVTGLVQGQIDLYLVDSKTGKVEQLTDDAYSEMLPSWSEDGSRIVYSTDQLSQERGRTNGKWVFNLARLDLATKGISHIDVFPGADNMNPVLDTAQNIIFLSNRDGFRNAYKYEVETGKVFQLTDFITGISGITPYAPALSVARKRDRVVFSHYLNNEYTIYRAKPEDFTEKEVDSGSVNHVAATLPRLNPEAKNLVNAQLNQMDELGSLSTASVKSVPYKSKFKLDYVGGGAGVGVSTSQTFGTNTGIAGSIDLLFSDILGNNQFFTSISLNGELKDFGGAVAYINRKNRIYYGASLSHIPFRSSQGSFLGIDTIPGSGGFQAEHYQFLVRRIFEEKVGVFAQLPFSRTLRLEAGLNAKHYSTRFDLYDNYYDSFGRLIGQEKEKLDAPEAYSLFTGELALVSDNSSFGLTSPLNGHRYRLGIEQYYGKYEFTAVTADLRAYKFLKPIGLAGRIMHYGRYGGNGNDISNELYPLFIGSPWYVRGFNTASTQELFIQNKKDYNALFGSKMLVANFEVRIPFTGPEQLALYKSKFLFTDLNFFVDGGLAWFDFDQFNENNDSGFLNAEPVFSAGASMRVNLFGALILEPYYAFPIMKNTRGTFGLNIIQGW